MARNNLLQLRRGADSSLPSSGLAAGEPLFSTDNMKLYIASNGTTTNWVGAPIVDQDNMADDSAVKLATQQSIKKYVDDQVAAKDALSELTDTTIASLSSGHMLFYDGSDSWDNKAMSGDATINSSGALTIAASSVEGSMLNANVPGHGIEINSSALRVKLDGGALARSSSGMTIAATGVTNAMLAGSIAITKLAASTITVSDGSSSTATSLGGTITFAGTSNEVTVDESSGTIQIGLPNDVTIAGNLTVSGDTVTTNVATVSIEDPLVSYASGNSANAVDIGFYGKYVESSTTKYLGLAWDADQTEFILFEGNQAVPTTTVNKSGTGFALSDLRLGTIHAATVDGGSY
jgi:hypothetical protein